MTGRTPNNGSENTTKGRHMTQAPLDPRFVRKLSLLCCHCVRNIAYYRVGFANEDGMGDLKEPTQFGATVNSNMLDIAVLEWCKLFADRQARHHWKRVVRDEHEQKRFLGAVLAATRVSLNERQRYLDDVRVYRDKFVAQHRLARRDAAALGSHHSAHGRVAGGAVHCRYDRAEL